MITVALANINTINPKYNKIKLLVSVISNSLSFTLFSKRITILSFPFKVKVKLGGATGVDPAKHSIHSTAASHFALTPHRNLKLLRT